MNRFHIEILMFNWAAHISKTKSKSMLSSSTFGSKTKAPPSPLGLSQHAMFTICISLFSITGYV